MGLKTAEETAGSGLATVVGIVGLAIMFLSFQPWMNFEIHSSYGAGLRWEISGDNFEGISGFGDGRLTAVAAGFAVAAAFAIGLRMMPRRLLGGSAMLTGLLVMLIGVDDVAHGWSHGTGGLPVATVAATPSVELGALASLGALLGLTGLGLLPEERRSSGQSTESQAEPQEVTEAWA